MRIRSWIVISLFMAGCAVGPNYKRPDVRVPQQFRGVSAAEAASLADQPWWEIFGDETLKSLIDEALRNNYDVRAATWRVEEFRARAGIVRSQFYPQIGYEAGWSRSRESAFVEPGGARPRNLHEVNLGLSWELDLWGRIRRLNEAALAQYLSTQEAQRGVLVSVVSETAQAYFELRDLEARLAIARRTTEAFDGTYNLFSQQVRGGVASHLELSRAEAALKGAAATIPDLEQQIVAQENLICFLLGRIPGPIPPGSSLTEQPLPPEVPPGLPSTLLERRPDIRQAEQQLVSANAQVGAAMAEFFPKISITGAFGGASPEVSDLFAGGKMWSIAAGLAGPLFQGGRLKNQYDADVAVFEQTKVQYESVVTRAFGEVSTALSAYAELASSEKEQARSVAAYQEAVELANIRYRAGLANYIEVLDAEQQLFPAENTLAQKRLARLTSLVALYKSLGGGWSLPAGEASSPSGSETVARSAALRSEER